MFNLHQRNRRPMTNIRRYYTPNARVFMTLVCRNRERYLAGTRAKQLLLSVLREVKGKLPFAMLGYVILDDHFHWLIRVLDDFPRGVSGSAAHTLTYGYGCGGDLRRGEDATAHTRTYSGERIRNEAGETDQIGDSGHTEDQAGETGPEGERHAGQPDSERQNLGRDSVQSPCRRAVQGVGRETSAGVNPRTAQDLGRNAVQNVGQVATVGSNLTTSDQNVGQVATVGSNLTTSDKVKLDKARPEATVAAGPTISTIVQAVKLRFTHRYKKDAGISTHLGVWQRRFWDHIIRDQEDFNRHLDYIHYNPVKHGYVSDPLEFEWSSFGAYLERGKYRRGWGCVGEPEALSGVAWE